MKYAAPLVAVLSRHNTEALGDENHEERKKSMAEADAEVRYLAVGANRFPAVADWHEDGLLAFGADNNVCLWNPGVRG